MTEKGLAPMMTMYQVLRINLAAASCGKCAAVSVGRIITRVPPGPICACYPPDLRAAECCNVLDIHFRIRICTSLKRKRRQRLRLPPFNLIRWWASNPSAASVFQPPYKECLQ